MTNDMRLKLSGRTKFFSAFMTFVVATTVFMFVGCNFITLTPLTVSYNGNGSTSGSVPVDSMGYLSAMSVSVPGNTGSLTRTGSTFGGWNTNSAGTGIARIPGSTFVIGPANVTLYAKWLSVSLDMVDIPGGSFQMGTPAGAVGSDESPDHPVTVTGFMMGKYEVTQAKYLEVMGFNPSYFAGETDALIRPVEFVTWFDAVVFCNQLSQMEGLESVYTITDRVPATGYPITSATVTYDLTKNGYRLPTEEEWEYAARGGDGSPGGFLYSGSDTIDTVAWHWALSDYTTHPVGLKDPNGLGLYDMTGNVWERGNSWYGSYTPIPDVPEDYSTMRVYRGGSYMDLPFGSRTARRSGGTPGTRGANIGFRVVRSL